MSQAIAVKNAYTMMVAVELDEKKKVLRVRFADDLIGELPLKAIKTQGELDLGKVRLDTPYDLRIGYKVGTGHVNLPWDFVRAHCDPNFEREEKSFSDQAGRCLGERIVEYRKALGFSQDQLAQAAGISRMNLSRIERGSGTSPTFTTLQKIARALKVDVFDLVDVESEIDR